MPNSPSLLGEALDLVINRSHDRTPDGRYQPLSAEDRLARLMALPGHPSRDDCDYALERAHTLLECAEFLGIVFHRGGHNGPEGLRSEYREAAEGFTDAELYRAFWEGVMRMRK